MESKDMVGFFQATHALLDDQYPNCLIVPVWITNRKVRIQAHDSNTNDDPKKQGLLIDESGIGRYAPFLSHLLT